MLFLNKNNMKSLLNIINENFRIDEANFNINGKEQHAINGEELAKHLGFNSINELLNSKHPILKQNVIAEVAHHINNAGSMLSQSIFNGAYIYMRDNFTGWDKYKDAVAAAKINKITTKHNINVRGNGPKYKVSTGKFKEMVEHCMYYVEKDALVKDIRIIALVNAGDEEDAKKGTGNNILDWIIANFRYNNSKSRPMDIIDFEIIEENNKTIVNYIGKKVVSTAPKTKTMTNGEFEWGKFNAGLICGKTIESLIGGPKEVNGDFNCSNTKITSLEGAPEKVGNNFDCSGTNITSYDFFPKEIGGDVCCGSTLVTSLKGVPKKINGSFTCQFNDNMRNLEGAPDEIKYSFSCYRCEQLISLEGAPKKIGRSFNCSRCDNLTSLKGAPKKVEGNFDCTYCKRLTSLKGAPLEVDKIFDCSNCEQLTSLEGAPQKVNGNFYCGECPNLKSLEGLPKIIGNNFSCWNCPKLKSLDNDSKIGGEIYTKDRWC